MSIDDRPYDAESVVIDATKVGGPVDPPDVPVTWADVVTRPDNLKPIIPATLRAPGGAKDLARATSRYAGHRALYHLTRLPKYCAKVALWSPVGLYRTTRAVVHWARAEEGNWDLRQAAARSNDPDTWMRLDARRQRQASWRWPVVGAGALALVVGLAVLVLAPVPALVQLGVWIGIALGLARLGRPIDKPIVDRVLVGVPFIKLTAEMTRQALIATGKVKRPEDVRFERDIFRDPPGQTAEVVLPAGVIATDIMDERERLASGFRLPVDQVWPEPIPTAHPGVLRIWVADKPVNAMRRPAWPLLNGGRTDFWADVPYGFDVRLRPRSYRAEQRNSLFAGLPGSGKSLAIRAVALGLALDPLVMFAVSELKGSGDFDMFEPLCPRNMYISGADESAMDRTLELLRWLDDECGRRAVLANAWAKKGLNTENKINRRIAEADPRCRPLVVILDEVQEIFSDPERKKEAIALVTSIIKRGRAYAIHLMIGTQRIDKESVPRGISSNVAIRNCMGVQSHVEVDLVLGTGAYKRGARPTDFMPPPEGDNPWAGWGVMAGNITPACATYLSNADAVKVIERALEMRHGRPEIDVTRVPAYNLLADVRQVWPASETALWLEILIDLLSKLRPEVYGRWDKETLGATLRRAGVEVVQIKRKLAGGKEANRRGIQLTALRKALAAADAGQPVELEGSA